MVIIITIARLFHFHHVFVRSKLCFLFLCVNIVPSVCVCEILSWCTKTRFCRINYTRFSSFQLILFGILALRKIYSSLLLSSLHDLHTFYNSIKYCFNIKHTLTYSLQSVFIFLESFVHWIARV